MTEPAIDFIDWLASRYQVGKGYASAYLSYWNENQAAYPLGCKEDIEALQPPQSYWFEFALSANVRGRALVDAITARLATSGGTALDIGCGFGGMLVALKEKGYEVTGVEIDPVRVRLSSANLDDIGVRGKVSGNSILDPLWVRSAGQFDLITCIDVIEHVNDVSLTLSHIAQLLRPGGYAFLEIPNKDAVQFVAEDGHFSLPGITQLPRWAAIQYHSVHHAFRYDVGDYYHADHYRVLAGDSGLHFDIATSPLHSLPELDQMKRVREQVEKNINADARISRCDPDMVDMIQSAMKSYLKRFDRATAAVDRGETPLADYTLQYGSPFWLVTLQKPS